MDKERIWRCECGGNHFLSISLLDWGDGREWYVSIIDAERAYDVSLWGRIKAAVSLLRGRRHVWTEMLLTEEMAYEMTAELESAYSQMRSNRLLGGSDA